VKQHEIPQTLDAPPLLLIFNAHQLIAFFGFTIVGVTINHPFIMAIFGLIVGSFFTRYADKKPTGFLRHLAYYYGVPTLTGRRTPNGWDREFRS